jgi:small subunit ribosomal protein S20
MPHHKSAKKRVGTNEKARVANLAVKSRVRTAVKKVRESKSQKDAVVRLESALSILDRAAQKGIIHRTTASRHKSRLTLFVHKLPA